MQSESCDSNTDGMDIETLAVIEREVQLRTHQETESIVNNMVHSVSHPSTSIDNHPLVPDIIQLQNEHLCNKDVVQSIAKKESEILSMIMLNNEGTEKATENVKQENYVDCSAKGDSLVQTNQVDTGQNIINQNDVQMVDDENVVTMEFHAADVEWITLFDTFEYVINDSRIRGYVEGEKKFLCLWECFQTSTMSTFTIRSSDRYYKDAKEGQEGSVQGRILKGSPKWSRTPLIPYDGVPFVSVDRKYFGCR